MKTKTRLIEIMMFVILSALSACSGNDGQKSSITQQVWVWVAGDNAYNQAGAYGTKGIPSGTNKPGARQFCFSWRDSSGNLWVFGGNGQDSTGLGGYLDDLWKFDGSNWTWVSGDNTRDQIGVYGSKGVPAGTNKPGARMGGVSWRDNNGNLWLFGGAGFDGGGTLSMLNDLWKFDGTNWTWVAGNSTGNQTGVYGTQGVAAGTNKPGSRSGSISWIDGSGNLLLFGGEGYDSAGNYGDLNDVWKFDGSKWIWISGDTTRDQSGVYGTKGVAAATSKPGARSESMSWRDSDGNVWLFAGVGYDSAGSYGYLNDLWKFNGTDWTWISGDTIRNQTGVYGTKGVPAGMNKPGSREGGISWIDNAGNLWLFGGSFYSSSTNYNLLDDLWKFDGTNWTWMSGDSVRNESGAYGNKGTASPSSHPGARWAGAGWIDGNNDLWLFGGFAYGSNTAVPSGYVLNDLWKYTR